MEDNEDEAAAAAAADTRWTCEACGCNTNAEADRNCTICGTSKSGPSILRRAGAAGYAARAGWFARGLGGPGGAAGSARRAAAVAGIMGDEMSLEDDDLWESVVHGGGEMGPDMEALAMEVNGAAAAGGAAAGGAANAARSRLVESSRQRFLEAARAFSQANREAHQALDPVELLRTATANAASYQPHWTDPTTLSGPRSRGGNGIEVGQGAERRNLALLPMGAPEGRAIRAEQPIVRSESNSLAQFRMVHPPSAVAAAAAHGSIDVAALNAVAAAAEQGGDPRRRAFGFRVAFDHPTTGDMTGANMGGCYLVGVTTSSFTSYTEQNGLQQSPFFWGIEDGGQKYEGSRHSSGRTARRSVSGGAAAAAYAVELGAQEAPMNGHGVLFGAREVITCVCDFDTRTLTFWRDETLLGTLVTNLPRSGILYPVAVPFNCGVTVAITGLDNDPLPLLRTFATDWRKVQRENDSNVRTRLVKERSMLIQNGGMSPKLRCVLEEIFTMYAGGTSTGENADDEEPSLPYTMAARLWYRCGMKLASLDSILEAKEGKCARLQLIDFLEVIEQVIEEDEAELIMSKKSYGDESTPVSSFEVGDKVELVEGYEKFGDAAGGPLQAGDRGVVVELQVGPNGEKRSIRVLHNCRRWWYQPQALVSERSGLTESPGVWFLRCLLRWHGYEHTSLVSLVGRQVTPTSWRVGDIVVPKKSSSNDETKLSESLIGRIVVETPGPASPTVASQSRESGTVVVEFLGRAFADGVGIKLPGVSSQEAFTLETRRVRTSKLLHSVDLNRSLGDRNPKQRECADESDEDAMKTDDRAPLESSDTPDVLAASVTDKLRSDIAALGRLEKSAIDAVTKECRKGSDALASLFSAGLQNAILSAFNVAERQMNSLEPRDDLSEKLAAIGALASSIVDELFGDSGCAQQTADVMDTDTDPSHRPASPQNRPRHLRNRVSQNDRRPRARDPLRRDPVVEDRGEGLVSSLQQRRNMLMSLMSRASRRSNAGAFLNDMAEAGIDPSRELSLGQVPPPLAPMRGVPPYAFGSASDFLESGSWEESQLPSYAVDALRSQQAAAAATARENDREAEQPLESADAGDQSLSFLDSILRCRGDVLSAQLAGGLKQGGAAYSVFVRHLINSGVLVDSVKWVMALVEAHSKKVQMTSLQRTSSILRSVADEEGRSLLLLAISLGCSPDVVSRLVGLGTPVGSEEIKQAARTNQPKTLSLLLQHTSYSEGDIDVDQCSPAVSRVLAHTKSRQEELDKRMRDAAGDFMVQLLKKLFKLGLSARQTHTVRIDMCSKVICEMLVGNVLLRALQQAQKPNTDPSQAEQESDRETSGRFSAGEGDADFTPSPQGLLGSLPRSILGDCLFAEKGNITMYLLLCEDYLCSKEMADTAAGLTFLSILLTKFPKLKTCEELKRFGVSEFVSNHNVLASNRIADILSKQLTIGLDVSASPGRPRSDPRLGPSHDLSRGGCGVVLCPKKHTAVLHITRHSSFRCDLCSSGVERGRPMHGCRECDWDACEDCTDRSESGLVKCSALRELASDCVRLLADVSTEEKDDYDYGDFFEANDRLGDELSDLSARLLQRDVLAAKELGILLNEPGRITIHQFLTIILPSLHGALIGRTKGSDGAHRNKKARVVDDAESPVVDSRDVRLEFCREALRYIMNEGGEGKLVLVARSTKHSVLEMDDSEAGDEDENEEPPDNEEIQAEDGKVDISYSAGASEILRRLHQVLSFYECVQVFASSPDKGSAHGGSAKSGDLHSLTKPIELHLSPSAFNDSESVSPKIRSVLYAEPLVPFADLQLHVLRTYRVNDPFYASFCRRLASDNAIIIERPMKNKADPWQIARIVGFDEKTGAHCVRYASGWKRGQERPVLHVDGRSTNDYNCLRYSGPEVTLVMAARQYYVLFRRKSSASAAQAEAKGSDGRGECEEDDSMSWSDDPANKSLVQAIGTRVESNCGLDNTWKVYTLVGKTDIVSHGEEDSLRFVLVSDAGELFSGVAVEQIRVGAMEHEEVSRSRRAAPSRAPRDDRNGLFPFFAARQRPDFSRDESEGSVSGSTQVKALKRTWSALALIDEMRPLDLIVSGESKEAPVDEVSADLSLSCRLEDQEFRFLADASALELPPSLSVRFSSHEKLPGVDFLLPADKTLICALKEMHQKQEKWSEWPPKPTCRLFFSVRTQSSDQMMSQLHESLAGKEAGSDSMTSDSDVSAILRVENRSRKLSSRSLTNDENIMDDSVTSLCDGVNEICVQCMEVVSLLSECAEDRSSPTDREVLNLPGFANPSLSKKLTDQLDDPVCVVGGALPDWCVVAASFAPRVFSYESRRMLLERAAFGVSRSTLRQQESKVNVGRLRQRMQSLRGRAVELVGEAFSGGADDPTALQLQADELYGMEEALATRVRSSFRAVKWQEHSLEVAKAVVSRDTLLSDAAVVMDRYANDATVCRRRLEIRFDGESGFDAASGDEAGVTRGFYADVAEALLAVENVAGVYCSSTCNYASPAASLKKIQPMEEDDGEKEAMKLPLWIPDMDSSAQVIIPTPRADKRSDLGIFPRALPHYHPQFGDVLRKFRFMGRLFAAAMRDGFMFPLPLSAAFLRLVQNGSGPMTPKKACRDPASAANDLLLSSTDLPRPGFLGGEVYAADYHICRALNRLDSVDPPLSRHELKRGYEEIATDKKFARVAFGKSYDYSFEEYFQDRTFVDPLDPDQGADAVPLCAKGHAKPVTVYNIREWVALAKNYILHEGVIEQALAFRRGVEDFFAADYLRLFTSEELQRDVCGVGDQVDNWNESDVRKIFKLDGGKGAAEALVAVAAIGGEGGAALSRRFGPSSPTIAFLVKALLEASPKQRRQFLSFVTSVPIVTPGRIEVVPILSPNGEFLPMCDPSCLPRANTCSRRLYLPKFETFESFSNILWAVVREESKFKGFYEWRGN